MIDLKEKIDHYLEVDLNNPNYPGSQVPFTNASMGQTQVDAPRKQPTNAGWAPVVEKLPDPEQVAERIANDILKDARPYLHKQAEDLRNEIFRIRPNLSQMMNQSWDKFKNFWRKWTGGVRESLEAYKVLSEYIEKLYEANVGAPPAQSAQQGMYNYDVARQAQLPGNAASNWQPNQYSIHDHLAVFLKNMEETLYSTIKKHILLEIKKRPQTSYKIGKNIFATDIEAHRKFQGQQNTIRNKIEQLKRDHSRIKTMLVKQRSDLIAKNTFIRELKDKLKQLKGDSDQIPHIEADPQCKACHSAPLPDQESQQDAQELTTAVDTIQQDLDDVFGKMMQDFGFDEPAA